MGAGGQRYAPPCYPGKEPQYPSYRSLTGHKGQNGQVWGREDLLPPPQFKPQTIQLQGVAILTTLSQPPCDSVCYNEVW
jgi:hypothetical protein